MYYARSGLKPVVASLAVLLLLFSAGVFAYDTRIQSGVSTPRGGLDQDSNSQTPQYLTFKLDPVAVSSAYKSGQGYAKVIVQGHTATIWISLFGGMPAAKLTAVMPVISEKGNDTVGLGSLTLSDGGDAQLQTQAQFDSGNYQVGLRLFDVSTFGSETMVVVSNPTYAQVVVTDQPTASSTTSQSKTSTTTTTETETTRTSTSNEHQQENVLAFQMVSLPAYLLAPQPSDYPFKTGGAYVKAYGTSVQIYVSFNGTPNTPFVVDLTVNGENTTIGKLVTNGEGRGVFTTEVPLGQGAFQLGVLLFTPSASDSQTLVALSVPRAQGLLLPQGITTTTTTTTTETTKSENHNENSVGLKFVLVPVPVWMGNSVPDNFPFRLGGAFVGLDGTSLQIMISFMGKPNTQFSFVLMTNNVNKSLGSATTSSQGAGAIRSTLSLDPGEYHLGVLVFSPTSDLVGLSIPRSETAIISNQGSTASASFQPMTFNFKLNPASRTTAQTGAYKFGRGEAAGIFADGVLAMYASIFNANPNTKYSVLLSVNGTSHDIANLITDQDGNAKVMMGLRIGNGTFVVGMRVNDTSSFASPRTVLISDPSVRLISTHFFEERVTTTTESETEHQGGPELKFKIVGAQVQNLSPTYSMGKGEANIAVDGQTLILKMEIEHANPNTEYSVSLSINGTSTRVGSLVTNHEGNGQVRAEWNLAPGTYLIGVLVYDDSSFATPTLVMTSDPASIAAVIVPSSSKSSSTTTTGSEVSHSVNTITGDKGDEDKIKLAVSSLTIPAVVHVGGSNASFSVIDPRFSVAVGRQANHGIIISISATNVTGPRILLLNLTQNSFLKLEGSALNVTLDGNPVVQASSVTQVLNPSPTDPARYVVVATSSGIQMLISIPHFSLHLIQVIPIPVAQIQNFLIVNAEVLVASMLVITLVFAALYKTRQKIF
jgi:hypothetical protein